MKKQENLSHNELITISLLETLEEKENMSKEEKDGIIMLLIEASIENNDK